MSDTWIYSVDDSEWREYDSIWTTCPPASYPAPRRFHAMVSDPLTGLVYLFGGRNASRAYLNDLWVFDPSSDPGTCPWSKLLPSSSPDPRAGHGMCLDSSRDVLIVFGGDGPPGPVSGFDDTWEYDIATNSWSEIVCSSHPAYLERMAMTYDSLYGVVILFGGRTPDESLKGTIPYYSETWEYEYSSPNWHPVNVITHPSSRYKTSMVYDEALQMHVLYGGEDDSHTLLKDTWEYTLSATPVPTNTPPPLPATGPGGKVGTLFIFSLVLIAISIRKTH
jgi:hypothetical protein